jgi:uncharacterized protein affecting Mg2+/Co2+ transport
MLHLVDRPSTIQFLPCLHRPTEQLYAIAPDHGTIETVHGTMSFRRGDYIMIGANGSLYAITAEAFAEAYQIPNL